MHTRPEAAPAPLRRLVLGLLAVWGCSPDADLEPLRSPLLAARPTAALEADLDAFVPAALERAGVPGASVAVVRRGEILFASGYGVADAVTRRPVTTRTAFEVASNSKPVTAYAALKLVDAGVLDLDAPLVGFLQRPCLSSPEGAHITLRHVLSHTSGLSNLGVGLLTDRRVWFPPGDHFSYSGHGYGYLGQVLEEVTGEPLARHLERTVLDPLGMADSGYRLEGPLAERMARPHLSARAVAGLALGLLLLSAFPVFGFGWLVLRLTGCSPALDRTRALSLAAASLVAGCMLAGALLDPTTALVAFFLLMLLLALVGAALVGARRLWRERARGGRTGVRALVASYAALCLATAGFLASRPAVPLPNRQSDIVAAGGLLSTAPDLARFLAELMAPKGLLAAQAREMLSPQVSIDDSLAWGLGIGLQRADGGKAIWHWGLNPGFESLMVGYPSEQLGVVVLTNGGPGLAGLVLAREIAHRAIGGEHGRYWMDVPGTALPATVRAAGCARSSGPDPCRQSEAGATRPGTRAEHAPPKPAQRSKDVS